jgi:CheY-like chemotaxis protein
MKTILVAEDNESNSMLVKHILSDYQIVHVENGKKAVEAMRNDWFDLVLMDIKMPIMDGLEATKKIKELKPGLPIVALTANAFDSDRVAAEEAGCCGFLSKPVNRDECITLLKKVLGE